MGKRHRDALAIQGGACNPRAIAGSLVEAIEEARKEDPSTDAIRADPACRLICHQLAYLFGSGEIDLEMYLYRDFTKECEERAKEVSNA